MRIVLNIRTARFQIKSLVLIDDYLFFMKTYPELFTSSSSSGSNPILALWLQRKACFSCLNLGQIPDPLFTAWNTSELHAPQLHSLSNSHETTISKQDPHLLGLLNLLIHSECFCTCRDTCNTSKLGKHSLRRSDKETDYWSVGYIVCTCSVWTSQ